jgi:hypothetical protein
MGPSSFFKIEMIQTGKFSHAIILYKIFYNKIVSLVFILTACNTSQDTKDWTEEGSELMRGKYVKMVFAILLTKFHDISIGISCLHSEGLYCIQIQDYGAFIFKQLSSSRLHDPCM